MHQRFKRKADKKIYGQRWQSETVNSMIKRNQSSALRARICAVTFGTSGFDWP